METSYQLGNIEDRSDVGGVLLGLLVDLSGHQAPKSIDVDTGAEL